MSTSGFGPAPTIVSSTSDLARARAIAEQPVKTGASWFVWIAGLSLVNSLVGMFGGGIHFIVGLGMTQFVDAIAHEAGSTGIVLDLIINGFVAGIFVLFWKFAAKGQKWAFVVGMLVYALDGLLLLAFKDILSVAFHAYALFRIYQGFAGVSRLEQLQQAALATGGSIQPR
jgi:hypothetical protein